MHIEREDEFTFAITFVVIDHLPANAGSVAVRCGILPVVASIDAMRTCSLGVW